MHVLERSMSAAHLSRSLAYRNATKRVNRRSIVSRALLLWLQDDFRMHGAKAGRHLYLFEKVLIITKRKEDGDLLVKESIQVRHLFSCACLNT